MRSIVVFVLVSCFFLLPGILRSEPGVRVLPLLRICSNDSELDAELFFRRVNEHSKLSKFVWSGLCDSDKSLVSLRDGFTASFVCENNVVALQLDGPEAELHQS